MKTNDFAFPLNRSKWACDGLTKREYFIAAALQGLLANPHVVKMPRTDSTESQNDITNRAIEIVDMLMPKL